MYSHRRLVGLSAAAQFVAPRRTESARNATQNVPIPRIASRSLEEEQNESVGFMVTGIRTSHRWSKFANVIDGIIPFKLEFIKTVSVILLQLPTTAFLHL